MKYPTDKGPLLLQLEKKTHRERKHFNKGYFNSPLTHYYRVQLVIACTLLGYWLFISIWST